MTSKRNFVFVLLLAVLPALGPLAATAASITLVATYDFPGASGTRILGVNQRGDLAGAAYFNDGVHPAQTAFIRFHDGRTRLFPPAAPSLGLSQADSINIEQQIGGIFLGSSPLLTGFEFQRGVFTPINEQRLTQTQSCAGACGTLVADINDPGDVAGGVWEGFDSNGMLVEQPFLITGGVAALLPIPPGFVSAEADGLDNHGAFVAGTTTNANNRYSGFVYRRAGGGFELFDFPGAFNTGLLGVNNQGVLTGYWFDATGGEHGLARINGELLPYDFPGAPTTELVHLNDAGLAVGSYVDSAGAAHGLEVQISN